MLFYLLSGNFDSHVVLANPSRYKVGELEPRMEVGSRSPNLESEVMSNGSS